MSRLHARVPADFSAMHNSARDVARFGARARHCASRSQTRERPHRPLWRAPDNGLRPLNKYARIHVSVGVVLLALVLATVWFSERGAIRQLATVAAKRKKVD